MYPQPAIVVAWLMKSEIQPQTCVLVLTPRTLYVISSLLFVHCNLDAIKPCSKSTAVECLKEKSEENKKK